MQAKSVYVPTNCSQFLCELERAETFKIVMRDALAERGFRPIFSRAKPSYLLIVAFRQGRRIKKVFSTKFSSEKRRIFASVRPYKARDKKFIVIY